MATVIGIDPGLDGALAVISPDAYSVEAIVMPAIGVKKGREIDCRGVFDFLVKYEGTHTIVYIEKVHSMPKQGVASSFKFGKGYGEVIGICSALGFAIAFVTPQAWKKVVLAGLNWKGNKAMSIQYVANRYPDVNLLTTPRKKKPHDGIADAVCIADYGRIRGLQ